MSRSRALLMVVVSWSGGCVVSSTSTSGTAGVFVADVRVESSYFVVTSCEIGYEVEKSTSVWPDQSTGLKSQTKRSDEFKESSCRSERVIIMRDERPAIPDGCRAAIKRWETTADDLDDIQRKQLWSEIPAACQAMIQGAGS